MPERRGHRARPVFRAAALSVLGVLLVALPLRAAPRRQAAAPRAQAAALLSRGLALFQDGKLREATVPLEAARALTPDDVPMLLLLGICYARLGDDTRAEPLLRAVTATGTDEDKAAARLFLGILYRDQGATDRAGTELAAAAQSPRLRSGVDGLLTGLRPHLLSATLIVSPEYDGNVPLTSLSAWRADPGASSDGDLLLLGSLTLRPSARLGLYFSNTLSYRQQFRFQDYNLLTNNTTAGYAYSGSRHRLRASLGLAPIVLGGDLLSLEVAWKAAYRVNLVKKLGVGLSYDGRYRSYRMAIFDAYTGHTHTLSLELSHGTRPDPLTITLAVQGVRDALGARPPLAQPDGTLVSDDFRAWAVGPALRLRARLHARVELALAASLLRRRFDDDTATLGRRWDWELATDASLSIEANRWLDVFLGTAVGYVDSTDAAFSFVKPVVYLGVLGHFSVR